MSVTWQPPPGTVVGSPRRSQLPWIGWALIAAWSFVGMAIAVYSTTDLSLDGQLPGRAFGMGLPVRADISLALFLVWIMSLNLACAGLIIGIVSMVRRTTGRLWRSVGLVTLIVGGGVAEFWGFTTGNDAGTPGHSGEVRLHEFVVFVVAGAVMCGAAALLEPRQSDER